jgi:hypoxanthine phosphoribosyltransferase
MSRIAEGDEKVVLDFLAIRARLARLELPEVDVVVGIATGGTVPASLVAYKLGCPLAVVQLNYRAEDNTPQRPKPELLGSFSLEPGFKRILLVDDASVTGKTLAEAKTLLQGCVVTTLVMKGRADIVLFPEVASCVVWPWKVS